jgi:hypothetical protein
MRYGRRFKGRGNFVLKNEKGTLGIRGELKD